MTAVPPELTVLALTAIVQDIQFAHMTVPANLQLDVAGNSSPRARTP